MRCFIINKPDGTSIQISSLIHPCDNPPPYEASPAKVQYTAEGPIVIVPALILDPEPLYDGPREHVTEILENSQESKDAMADFTGLSAIKASNPGLFST